MNYSMDFDQKNPTLRFAVEELSRYTLLIDPTSKIEIDSSAPPIAITIEPQPLDHFCVNIGRYGGYIKASSPIAALIAVYQILQELGVRFLRPGADFEYIPSQKITYFQINKEETASFLHRGVCMEGASSIENMVDFIDWLPKLGFNSFFVQFQYPHCFLDRWYSHVSNPTLEPQSFDLGGMSAQIDAAMELRGITHHRVGHGWTNEVLGYPSIGWSPKMLDDVTFDEALVAQIDGKRGLIRGVPANTNLCYSNPTAVDAMVNNVINYARQHQDVDILHVWVADEANHICECDECKKVSFTDQYVDILNRIDAGLTEKSLQTRIAFLLYQELLWPPTLAKIANKDRFVMMFAPISRTFNSGYSQRLDPPPIPEFKRNNMTMPVSLEENLSFLYEWQKHFDGDSFVYDYPLGRAHYGDLGYVSISKIIAKDIKSLKELKLNGYISCQQQRTFLPNGLPNYVMGKLLWNSSLTFEAIAADYYAHAYGNMDVLDYLSELSSCCNCDYFNRKGERTNPVVAANYRKGIELIEKTRPLINRTAGSHSKVHTIFWNILSYHANYSSMLLHALEAIANGDKPTGMALWNDFCEYIQKNEMNYQNTLDVFRITEVSSNYAGFKE